MKLPSTDFESKSWYVAASRTSTYGFAYVHRMKDLSASTILQDVAVKGINVAGQHAPEHARNLGFPMRFEPVRYHCNSSGARAPAWKRGGTTTRSASCKCCQHSITCLSTATLGSSQTLRDATGLRPPLLLLIAADCSLYIVPDSSMPGAMIIFHILVGIGAGATVLTPIAMVRSFPASVRVAGIAFSHNTAYAILGGATPPLTGWLNHMNRLAPAHYTGLAATVALIVVCLKRDGT